MGITVSAITTVTTTACSIRVGRAVGRRDPEVGSSATPGLEVLRRWVRRRSPVRTVRRLGLIPAVPVVPVAPPVRPRFRRRVLPPPVPALRRLLIPSGMVTLFLT